jgi:hypothetical protein
MAKGKQPTKAKKTAKKAAPKRKAKAKVHVLAAVRSST